MSERQQTLNSNQIDDLLRDLMEEEATESPSNSMADSAASGELPAEIQALIESSEPADERAEYEGDLRSDAHAAETSATLSAWSEEPDCDDALSTAPVSGDQPKLQPFAFPAFQPATAPEPQEVDVQIEMGRTQLSPADAQTLAAGQVIPLDQAEQDPVDIVVDGRVVARGEILVHENKFCVRIAEIVSRDD